MLSLGAAAVAWAPGAPPPHGSACHQADELGRADGLAPGCAGCFWLGGQLAAVVLCDAAGVCALACCGCAVTAWLLCAAVLSGWLGGPAVWPGSRAGPALPALPDSREPTAG